MMTGCAGITMADAIQQLPPSRLDEIFVALLDKALTINRRARTVRDLRAALGPVEGDAFWATFAATGGSANDEAVFVARCQRLNVAPEKIARFLLLA